MFLEMIKSLSISDRELQKRFKFTNLEVLREIESRNKSIVLMCAHYASYEWIIALQLYGLKYKSFGIYKKYGTGILMIWFARYVVSLVESLLILIKRLRESSKMSEKDCEVFTL